MYNKKCLFCGEIFSTSYNIKKFCQELCRLEYAKKARDSFERAEINCLKLSCNSIDNNTGQNCKRKVTAFFEGESVCDYHYHLKRRENKKIENLCKVMIKNRL